MWQLKLFRPKAAKDKWIARHRANYQIAEVFVHNGYGLEVRKLRWL